MQGNSDRLDNFVWTSKDKTPGSWGHFWNQYGMNVINEHDFFGLVGDLECTRPDNHDGRPAMLMDSVEEEENLEADLINSTGFKVTISGDDKHTSTSSRAPKIITGTHIDYDALQKAKSNIGKAGELLVVELLREQYEGTDTVVEHTSIIKGDGYGYDISVFHSNGIEERIEVKTTKTTYVDGFYITPRELNASRQCEPESTNKYYKIYRVYNFDPVNKTANIKIYERPLKDESFRLVPTAWKVYER